MIHLGVATLAVLLNLLQSLPLVAIISNVVPLKHRRCAMAGD
jgi:hypothetical protein